jgi:hypothetical protein
MAGVLRFSGTSEDKQQELAAGRFKRLTQEVAILPMVCYRI